LQTCLSGNGHHRQRLLASVPASRLQHEWMVILLIFNRK
jgi:hypothetical protein